MVAVFRVPTTRFLREAISHRLWLATLLALCGSWGWVKQTTGQERDGPNGVGSDLLSNPTVSKPAVSSGGNDHLLGDFGGSRSRLADRGVTLNLIYTGEVFGNPAGGQSQGAVYDGLLELGVDVDFAKLLGWKGATFHINAYDIHGPSGTDKYVRDFGRFSNIDYYDSIRLFELWIEQSFAEDKVSIRFGQLAADKEFFGSDVAALFINSDFGVLPTISANMSVPIYASAAPGFRLRVRLTPATYFQAAVFDGNPDPDALGDPSPGSQTGISFNRNGVKINLNSKEGAFSLYELGYRPNHEDNAKGLPGSYKLGAWYHTDTFSDLRSDRHGRSLADPLSDGIPRAIQGDFGAYLVIDQMIYRPRGSGAPAKGTGKDARGGGVNERKDGESQPSPAAQNDKGLTAFLRISGAPGDRNAVSFYTDAGFSYRGLVPGRDNDLSGIALAYTRFGDSERALDRDQSFFSHTGTPSHDKEVVVEGSYQAIIKPYWAVQPDLQVIIHPGGSDRYGDALVIGLRSVLTF